MFFFNRKLCLIIISTFALFSDFVCLLQVPEFTYAVDGISTHCLILSISLSDLHATKLDVRIWLVVSLQKGLLPAFPVPQMEYKTVCFKIG